MTNRTQADLITSLTADLAPVRPLRAARGWAITVLAAIGSAAIAVLTLGLSPVLREDGISSHYLIAHGLLVVLGLSASAAVIAMTSPAVGTRYDGPKWAIGMTAILPAAAVVLTAASSRYGTLAGFEPGFDCAIAGSLLGLLTAGALVWWLRQGAPVSPRRAGFYVGVAAGAFGSVGNGLACPLDSLSHLGIWHVLPVAVCAVMGTMIVPRVVRW